MVKTGERHLVEKSLEKEVKVGPDIVEDQIEATTDSFREVGRSYTRHIKES